MKLLLLLLLLGCTNTSVSVAPNPKPLPDFYQKLSGVAISLTKDEVEYK